MEQEQQDLHDGHESLSNLLSPEANINRNIDSISSLNTALDGMTTDDSKTGQSTSLDNSAKLSAVRSQKVRDQVDYYFSGANLKTDKFLLGKMRGRRNRPVPVHVIHGFRQMQQYQPFSAVVDALRTCENIDIIKETGVWCVQRKKPFISESAGVPKGKSNAPKKPKVKPTGFEEYFADGPTTPAESKEEEELYIRSIPVTSRIETALQRYQAKRRFTNHPRNIFDKWMRFGGVDSRPKMFSGGLDSNLLEDNSAAEIASINATTFIGEDKTSDGFDQKWVIDFEAVTKSFLSVQVPDYWDWEEAAKVQQCTGILRNFYNYLIHHSVCPEHDADIYAARKHCDLADEELVATNRILRLLPGDFNVACSTIFGGFHKGLYAEAESWTKDTNPTRGKPQVGLGDLRARQIFKFGVAQYASDDMFLVNDEKTLEEDPIRWSLKQRDERVGVQVIDIVLANEETRQIYENSPGNLRSLGILRCESWTPPDFAEDDLPPNMAPENKKTFDFYVEDELLKWCFNGMKLEATIYTLSSGMRFLDNVTAVKCSFYHMLENELTLKWKEPRFISRVEQLAREQKATEGEEDMEDLD